MRVSMDKDEENEKTSTKWPSTKYDHFMRVSLDENEENKKEVNLPKSPYKPSWDMYKCLHGDFIEFSFFIIFIFFSIETLIR